MLRGRDEAIARGFAVYSFCGTETRSSIEAWLSARGTKGIITRIPPFPASQSHWNSFFFSKTKLAKAGMFNSMKMRGQ